MKKLELIVSLGEHRGQWHLVGPYLEDPENDRFLHAIGRGLAAEGYAVRLEQTTEIRRDVPL